MSDTIKTILSIIGAVILSVFIVLCISMCFPNFRSKVNNALGGVPENEYNQSIVEKNNLYLEIETYSQKINSLNDEKQALLDKIAQLDLTNSNQAQLLLEYKQQIDNLNFQIAQLTDRLNTISVQLDNASIDFIGTSYHIFMPFFDDNGNYMCHGGYYDDNCNTWGYSGESLKNEITNNYENMLTNIERAKQSYFQMMLSEYYCYSVVINQCGTRIDNFNKEYSFNKDCSVTMETIFDSESVDISSVKDRLQDTASYTFNMDFNYSLDANNCVDTLNITITISSIQ